MRAVVVADHTLHNLRQVVQDSLVHPEPVLPELHYRRHRIHMLVRHTDVSFGQHWKTGHLRPGLGMHCRHNLVLGEDRIDHIAHAGLVHGSDNQTEERTS